MRGVLPETCFAPCLRIVIIFQIHLIPPISADNLRCHFVKDRENHEDLRHLLKQQWPKLERKSKLGFQYKLYFKDITAFSYHF